MIYLQIKYYSLPPLPKKFQQTVLMPVIKYGILFLIATRDFQLILIVLSISVFKGV